jgi:hypothetical protein
MKIKIFCLFFLLNALLINSRLIIQPSQSSVQELPFSDTPTLLLNESYEKSVSVTPSSSPLETRFGITIAVILYSGSVYLKLTENTTNSTTSNLFLDYSLPITWNYCGFDIGFGIYTIKFLNNESLNATFSFVVYYNTRWIDMSPLFLWVIILTPLTIGLILYFHLQRKREKQ